MSYRQDALTKLYEIVKPHTIVYTTTNHATSSGMGRWLSVFVVVDGEPFCLDWLLVRAGLARRRGEKHEGIYVGGAGMDMGFHVVYELSRALYSEKGYRCNGRTYDETKGGRRLRRCGASDHVNVGAPFRRGAVHHDGYALHHVRL